MDTKQAEGEDDGKEEEENEEGDVWDIRDVREGWEARYMWELYDVHTQLEKRATRSLHLMLDFLDDLLAADLRRIVVAYSDPLANVARILPPFDCRHDICTCRGHCNHYLVSRLQVLDDGLLHWGEFGVHACGEIVELEATKIMPLSTLRDNPNSCCIRGFFKMLSAA